MTKEPEHRAGKGRPGRTVDRRGALRLALAGGVSVALLPRASALAQPMPPTRAFEAARTELSAGRLPREGRVAIDMPRLAENGNSVPIRVVVESPMTAEDHVRVLHLLSEQNPIAVIGRFHLSPRNARAEIETYIRLATTQNVHAIAELSDGSLWTARAEVVVLLAACLDGG